MTASKSSIAQHERNVQTFCRLIEVGFGTDDSAGDVSVVGGAGTPGFVEHQAGVNPPNARGLKAHIALLHQIMPDTTCQIEDLLAGGDRVWARLRGRGTHAGAFMSRPPTGRRIELDILDVCRFEDGKIAEHRGPGRLGMLEQMGLAPAPYHASSRS